MIIISTFLSNLTNFYIVICFLTKLLTGILFSTAVNKAFVAKPLILGILPSISVILALQSNLLTSPLVSGILFSISDLSVLYLVFKTNLLVSIFLLLQLIYHTQFF